MIESLILPVWRGVSYTAHRPTGDDTKYITPDMVHVGDGWYVQSLSAGECVLLAGIPESYDMAWPECPDNRAQVEAHGGWAIFQYSRIEGGGCGQLVFGDEIVRRALDTLASLIVEKLEEPQRRFDALQHSKD